VLCFVRSAQAAPVRSPSAQDGVTIDTHMTNHLGTQELPLPKGLEGRRLEMFPTLMPLQLSRVAAVAVEQHFAEATVLYRPGDVGVPLFVVTEGEIELVDIEPSGLARNILLAPGEFTGEVNLLRGAPALVTARACAGTRVLRIDQAQLRHLLECDSEISDILLRAFILRRAGLIEASAGDAIVIGSRFSADTARLQSFLVQNVQPYRYVDVDDDSAVQSLLDEFHVRVSDGPVLICRGERVLRDPTDADAAECLGFNPALEPSVVHMS
jgi:thioredoxin reductase (NADPH)